MKYPVAAPDLSGNEAAYVAECLKSSWISSQGEYLRRFEQMFAEHTGVPHAIATCNGTVAIHLALAALDVEPGDEIIVPSLTFIATSNAVKYCGATAVFADCDPETWCISVESIERMITPRTVGILPVHLYGHPADMKAIRDLADLHGLWVVEDAAEAFGADVEGRRVGAWGEAATFSFFGNKIITTGEGGMVTTCDDRLADKMRLLRGQGFDANKRYWHNVIGYNYRMTNVAAAIGVAQMERCEALLAHRRRIAKRYSWKLAGLPGCTLPIEQPEMTHAWWMFTMLLDRPEHREPVTKALAADGIETRPVFYPVHEMPPYRDAPADGGCPVTTSVSYRGISLPSSSYLTDDDVDHIADRVRAAVAGVRTLRKAA